MRKVRDGHGRQVSSTMGGEIFSAKSLVFLQSHDYAQVRRKSASCMATFQRESRKLGVTFYSFESARKLI